MGALVLGNLQRTYPAPVGAVYTGGGSSVPPPPASLAPPCIDSLGLYSSFFPAPRVRHGGTAHADLQRNGHNLCLWRLDRRTGLRIPEGCAGLRRRPAHHLAVPFFTAPVPGRSTVGGQRPRGPDH